MGLTTGGGVGSALSPLNLQRSHSSQVISAHKACAAPPCDVLVPGPCPLPSKFPSFPHGFPTTTSSRLHPHPAPRQTCVEGCPQLLSLAREKHRNCTLVFGKINAFKMSSAHFLARLSLSLSAAERKEAFLDNYSPRELKDWLCLLSVFSYNT